MQAVEQQRGGGCGIGLADPAVLQGHRLAGQGAVIERLPPQRRTSHGAISGAATRFRGNGGDQ